jgi:hypothetical protein
VAVEVARAVDRAVVVDPARHPGRRPRRPAVEEVELLEGDAQDDVRGEELGEPWAARPHDPLGLERAPVVEPHRPVLWPRDGALEPRAGRLCRRRQGAHAPLGAQHPRLGLPQHEGEVVRPQRREVPRRVAGLERSAGMPWAASVASDSASQPSSRAANQAIPHSTMTSVPVSASSSRHSPRARRAEAV